MTPRDASWDEVAARLEPARSYWLGTCDAGGAPHVVPVWGAVLNGELYFFSERRTAKARHVTANPQVVVHLESPENVVIVNGVLEDLGRPSARADVLRALETKYDSPEDARYLPTSDPDFDVLWQLRPRRAMLWHLDEYDGSQARWRAD
jgi:nitroimidazol reductase NimA-like FMN-containing flavoprotein (pyridoxamine 5'-phosphate oxidase superfamily)